MCLPILSDVIGVMYLGHMVEIYKTSEIYRTPLHPYTQGLLSAIPVPSPKLAREKTVHSMEGDIPSPISPPSGCHFHTRCRYASSMCSEIEPTLKPLDAGHSVACHLY